MRETPRYGHKPIDMRNVGDDRKIEKLGDFYWRKESDTHVLWLAIPSDDKERDFYTVIRILCASTQSNKVWQWNGDKEKPTLSPSVHTIGYWHGWIRDGRLVEA